MAPKSLASIAEDVSEIREDFKDHCRNDVSGFVQVNERIDNINIQIVELQKLKAWVIGCSVGIGMMITGAAFLVPMAFRSAVTDVIRVELKRNSP